MKNIRTYPITSYKCWFEFNGKRYTLINTEKRDKLIARKQRILDTVEFICVMLIVLSVLALAGLVGRVELFDLMGYKDTWTLAHYLKIAATSAFSVILGVLGLRRIDE